MTVHTVVIPTDGSDRSNAAAHRGFDLAEAFDASVHVLSVADSSVATGTGYSGDSPSVRKRLREAATERASSLREEAIDRGIETTAVTREGIPAKEIVRYAEEASVDAISMGTAGRGGVARTVVGSVADKVVRTAPVPVITITPKATGDESTGEVNSILLPTDGSEAAAAVADLGFELAAQLDAAVHLLSVVDRGRLSALSELFDGEQPAGFDDEGTGDGDSIHERANDHLEALASDARDRELDVRAVVRDGDPAEETLRYVESEAIDLIAMGTSGLGGFERLLIGSVTDTVLRDAPVPVLTTRPAEPDD